MRRRKAGILVSPYRNLYARIPYWNALNPIERHMHVAKALAMQHPSWVFAGLTAACAHGLEHGYSLHDDQKVTIASTFPPTKHQYRKLRRIYMTTMDSVRRSSVTVTDINRTLTDCAMAYSFIEALPFFDSAARQGTTLSKVLEYCRGLGMDTARIVSLCEYADPLSENGGESWVRAVIIQLGFVIPRLQRPFHNPRNPDAPFRADFSWELPDGTIIVAEFDGMGKYVLEDGTRQGIRERVYAERERETALRNGKVRRIVRLDYEDAQHPERLRRKLLEAGVPMRRCL
ncbi:hypothetical protein GFD17_00190 [Bifidobacterium sp. SMB2]|uniref:CTP synthase n=1 Tax=Bifidobacterium saimiriisciurei TaxID=2661627 RepID=A0ABX0C7Z4_9BIFI|nr:MULTISPECIES: hypothetical protein [Bifidobacterium]NEG95202.1 hypothetical protein [Bifidobacterium sp. SMB2]NEH11279.1 hypothetical protein [Bifidobacterium saimiriisciurei]